jgi:hypothetical protein
MMGYGHFCFRLSVAQSRAGSIGRVLRRQDKSDAVAARFCWSDQWVIAFSPKGPAGALYEFTNDINGSSAIRTALRQESVGKRRGSSRQQTR